MFDFDVGQLIAIAIVTFTVGASGLAILYVGTIADATDEMRRLALADVRPGLARRVSETFRPTPLTAANDMDEGAPVDADATFRLRLGNEG